MKKVPLFLTGLFLLSGIISAQKADDVALINQRVKAINQEILSNGLQWKAKVNNMSLLAPAEQRQKLGALTPINYPDSPVPQTARAIAPSLDWRSYQGQNWNTPVRDQGGCGSCWAFGTVAVMESLYKIEQNRPEVNLDLSEQHLVSCSNAGNCIDGGYAWEAAEYARTAGVSSENCFPYTALDDPCNPCSDWEQNVARLTGSEWVTVGIADNTAIMSALQNSPLIGWFEIYSDFYHYSSGIYEKTPSATLEGGHIISIVGYNQSQQYWICKNSWGPSWGEQGYFRIAWDQVGIGKFVIESWGVTLRNRPPVLGSIGNKSVKEGQTLAFQVTASDADHDPLILSVSGLPSGSVFTTDAGQFSWTPGFTQSGTYELTFSVTDGKAIDRERMVITVVNVKKGNGRI